VYSSTESAEISQSKERKNLVELAGLSGNFRLSVPEILVPDVRTNNGKPAMIIFPRCGPVQPCLSLDGAAGCSVTGLD
jgi:hypothetical protein